ncbi:MAG: 50S ribosomal protein L32e [Nanoarchaeota archaeon]|nr:50S ribosomal protein L32e [Nanoarchaeota archaeon]
MKKLIILRKAMKAKKPDFRRQDSHKKKRVGVAWRKPKGLQSKMRLCRKGYRNSVSTGYGSPKQVAGLSKEGLVKVNVACVKDLENIDNKAQGIIINSSVGNKKRLDIFKVAKEKQIAVLNIKDTEKYAAKIESGRNKKKEDQVKKDTEKKKKVKEAEEKKSEKLESKVENVSDEDKKLIEKKEKDKILISKRE